jgi:DNA-directed RNA polymerase I, II, and III subunit RPABC2
MSESEEEDITVEEDETMEDSDVDSQVGDELLVDEELTATNHSVAGFPDVSDDSSEDSEEETLQKFDRSVITDYISLYHPETKMHNDEEISALTVVTRNQYGDVIDPLHNTTSVLTKFEKTKILGVRSKQLDEGAESFIQVPPNVISSYTIALMELKEKKIPFILRRPIPNGGSEYWKITDLEII